MYSQSADSFSQAEINEDNDQFSQAEINEDDDEISVQSVEGVATILVEGNQSEEEEEEETQTQSFELSEEIKKIKKEDEPQCCGCLNICAASSFMGLFYVLPIILYAVYYYVLYRISLAVFLPCTLIAVICGVIAILCFYNAYQPQVWSSEWIGSIQTILFFILTLISFAALIFALLQACNWGNSKDIEDHIDAIINEKFQKNTGGDTAYYFFTVVGIVSFILGAISMYIASAFRDMANHIFDQGIFKDYEALKELERESRGPVNGQQKDSKETVTTSEDQKQSMEVSHSKMNEYTETTQKN